MGWGCAPDPSAHVHVLLVIGIRFLCCELLLVFFINECMLLTLYP